MTYLLTIDPGRSTGIALGFYDAITPYRLIERWNVLGGVAGFIHWWKTTDISFDEIVIESFVLDPDNKFSADLTPVQIEGMIMALLYGSGLSLVWQPRTDKAGLKPYPKDCTTSTQRQRFRFDFLDQFGLFAAGAANDDSNDAVTHALVHLKRLRHMPSMLAFWPPRPLKAVA